MSVYVCMCVKPAVIGCWLSGFARVVGSKPASAQLQDVKENTRKQTWMFTLTHKKICEPRGR
eukprot:c37638_g1_i1 orf=2-184(-)